jgi:hypothetical protein
MTFTAEGTIDLSKYVGETVGVQLGDDSFLTGQVSISQSSKDKFPYVICGYWFQRYGVGYTRAKIVRILPFEKIFSGIAQKAPNINLDDFVGQKVYVKLGRGSEHITNVSPIYNLSEIGQYKKNGTSASGNEHWAILEIYGAGAYEINTKSTFDNPNDYKIEQAKQLLSQMSEEQVAKLLKSLK